MIKKLSSLVTASAALATGAVRADNHYSIVARTGQVAPAISFFSGTPYPYESLRDAEFNENGTISFYNTTAGGYGLFYDRAGQIEPLAYEGQLVPGYSHGEMFASFPHALISSGGNILLYTGFSTFGTPRISKDSLFSGSSPQSLTMLALGGDPAPGLDNQRLAGFSGGGINNSGQAAFAGLTMGSDGTWTGWGLFAKMSGNLQLLANQGDPAPGITGATIGQPYVLRVTDDAEIIYETAVTGGTAGALGHAHRSPRRRDWLQRRPDALGQLHHRKRHLWRRRRRSPPSGTLGLGGAWHEWDLARRSGQQ